MTKTYDDVDHTNFYKCFGGFQISFLLERFVFLLSLKVCIFFAGDSSVNIAI